MIGIIFAVICAISLIFSLINGNVSELSMAIAEGAEKAVMLAIALCGMMGLWNGVMNVLEKVGACAYLSKIIRPLTKLFFPTAGKDEEASGAISSSVAANMLGIGNAATPLGIRSMKAMQKIGAEDDMITFAVMNTAPFSLMPSTLIALRSAGGAENPFDVAFAVWICSAAAMTFALILCRAFSAVSKLKR